MAIDRARTVRGAVAGAVAAGVWALQQPLDRRVFGVPYDDTELLGKAVTRGRAWPAAGPGAAPAQRRGLRRALRERRAAGAAAVVGARSRRGAARALRDVAAGRSLTDRLHPARDDLPKLAADPAAFAQATWRHLLFGVVLGELERRLNADDSGDVPSYEHVVSTNGHGDLEQAVGVARP